MSLIGMDIGSTNCKAVLFDAEGNQLASASREYGEVYPGPSMIELRPQEMWAAICEVLGKVSAAAGGDPPQAVSFSALGEAFTPIGRDGEFLHNTIVSPDNRAVAIADRWRDSLGAQAIFEITGMPIHPSFTLNKIIWLKENRPEIHARTWKYLLWPDLVFYKLGLPPRLDWSLAGRTMAFDVVHKCWSGKLLDAAGITPELFAEPVRPGTLIGEISAEASAQTGLPKGCLVVAGGHDQPMNALGAGVIKEGMAVDGMGTVECITVAFEKPVLTADMLAHNYCCYPHVCGDLYASLAFNYSCGALLRWFRDNFARLEAQEAAAKGVDVYDYLLSDLPEGPSGLLLVPYFAGSGTPYMDPRSSGAILGLTLGCDQKRFLKGILEGVCFDLALNIHGLEDAGVAVDRLRCTGGGSKSPYWLQMKADITGKECVTLNITESGCQAAAMLAGVQAGVYGSVEEAVGVLVKEKESYEPRPAQQAEYAEKFALYKEVWPTIADIAHRLV